MYDSSFNEAPPNYIEPRINVGPPQSFETITRKKKNLQTPDPPDLTFLPRIEYNHLYLDYLNELSQKTNYEPVDRNVVMYKEIKKNRGAWSEDEHRRFLEGFYKCGRKWGKIAKEFVLTRDRTQVASHGQKFLAKLAIRPKS